MQRTLAPLTRGISSAGWINIETRVGRQYVYVRKTEVSGGVRKSVRIHNARVENSFSTYTRAGVSRHVAGCGLAGAWACIYIYA